MASGMRNSLVMVKFKLGFSNKKEPLSKVSKRGMLKEEVGKSIDCLTKRSKSIPCSVLSKANAMVSDSSKLNEIMPFSSVSMAKVESASSNNSIN